MCGPGSSCQPGWRRRRRAERGGDAHDARHAVAASLAILCRVLHVALPQVTAWVADAGSVRES